MIAIIDYGVGNLFSLVSSLKFLGIETIVTSNKEDIIKADKIILPGVGAFGDAIEKLEKTNLIPTIKDEVAKGKPLLGICLGMQLLFEESYEYGKYKGLGLIKGKVVEFDLPKNYKVPHMGWNSLDFCKKDNKLLSNINEGDYVYYVHSFHAVDCLENVVATSRYGIDVVGMVANSNVYGTQFHPEKSGEVGLKILKAFANL
ncbi:MAG: imidazole glycerol phosphate synthase subunit HisH [Clostridia bacterium]